MNENIYEKLNRVRKPRVHIQYEVETEQGVEQRELPFVLGVMGDFSGDPVKPLPPLKYRKFISIDRDNFDQVMSKMNVGLKIKVKNTFTKENEQIPVHLHFKSMKDFEPDQLIQQVDALKQLQTARDQLMDLLNKSECSEKLEEALKEILTNNQQLQYILNAIQLPSNQKKSEHNDL
jgi:type VI secretion system protein ImpB